MSHAFKGLGLAVLCLAGWQSASATPPVASSPIDSLDAQVWREECGACHVAFPPRLLPSSSWADIMRNLKDHFGTDASIETPLAQQIASYLEANASQKPRGVAPDDPLRITRSRWFLHEHDEIPSATWRRPAIGSPSNCSACHRQAEQGRFDEHSVQIPK